VCDGRDVAVRGVRTLGTVWCSIASRRQYRVGIRYLGLFSYVYSQGCKELTRSWHVTLTIIWEENAVYALPLVLFTLIYLAPFLALQPSLLVFIEAFAWYLLAHLATSEVSLMLSEGYVICKGRAAAVTLWW
jgi:hypothetical protein